LVHEDDERVGKAPYRLELTNAGVLALFDGTGRDIWESTFFDNRENDFSSLTQDPSIWPTGPVSIKDVDVDESDSEISASDSASEPASSGSSDPSVSDELIIQSSAHQILPLLFVTVVVALNQ